MIEDFESLASKPGNVHFTKEGNRKLGERVASVVAKRPKIKTNSIPDDEVLNQREKAYMDSLGKG